MNMISGDGLFTYIDNVRVILEELNPELVEAIEHTPELLEGALVPLMTVNYYNGVDQFDTAQAIVYAHADEVITEEEATAKLAEELGLDVEILNSPEQLAAALFGVVGADEEEGEDPLDIARDVLGNDPTVN